MAAMTPQDKANLDKIVMAAKKIMYDEKVFPMFAAGMKKEAPLPEKLAMESAGLMKMVQDKAKGGIPKPLLIPAAMMIMLEMADFMEKAGLAKPTREDLSAAMKQLIGVMNEVFGEKGGKPPAPEAPAPQGGLIQQPPAAQAQPHPGL